MAKYGATEQNVCIRKDDFVYDNNGELVTVWALNGKEVAAGTPGAKEMNKLKDPNGVYQDFLQSGDFKFGPGDVKICRLEWRRKTG